MTSDIPKAAPNCEIISFRTVNASQDIVFNAWTDPNHLKNWWGPKGFTNTFNVFDLRPGGKWSFVMHGPDKGNYHNECEFIKIDRPSLLVWKRYSKPLFQVVVTFDVETDGRTKVIFRMIFDTAEECNKLKVHVVDKNEENFDKLEAELLKMTS